MNSNQQVSHTKSLLESNKDTEKNVLNAIKISSSHFQDEVARLSAELYKIPDQGKQRQRYQKTRKLTGQDRRDLLEKWYLKNKDSVMAVSDKMSALATEEKEEYLRGIVLHSLNFPQQKERYATMAKAHAKTFGWIFRTKSNASIPWTDFVQWLSDDEAGDHLYWITGKPGGGKSTLMKYLYHDQLTQSLLQRWAGSQRLVIASCFSWNPGSSIQISLTGLLRALLHEILLVCPELVPLASPWRWQSYELGARKLSSWSNRELLDSFQNVVQHSKDKIKLCLFIDGLDESEGDDTARTEIIELFKTISQHGHIIVCLSSHPWLMFTDAFEGRPSLLLQQLTYNDIKSYVQAELEKHHKFRSLRAKDQDGGLQLILGIVDKAERVFLWVYLAVRSLLEGLRNEDGIKDLRRRLDLMPADFEKYFTHILARWSRFISNKACSFSR